MNEKTISLPDSSPEKPRTRTSDKTRSKIIIKSGLFFILTNFLLAIFNLIVGLLSGSIAIISDSFHSLIDAVSGFLIIISEKLAENHKFSASRSKIERITTILIALIIIAVGVHIVIESFEKLVEPEALDISPATIIILIASIIAKLSLAIYLKRNGRRNNSEVLIASGAETLNDTWISVAVLISVIVYLATNLNIEGYISLGVAIVIFKVGLEFIFPHISSHHHHPLETDPDHDHCHR